MNLLALDPFWYKGPLFLVLAAPKLRKEVQVVCPIPVLEIPLLVFVEILVFWLNTTISSIQCSPSRVSHIIGLFECSPCLILVSQLIVSSESPASSSLHWKIVLGTPQMLVDHHHPYQAENTVRQSL